MCKVSIHDRSQLRKRRNSVALKLRLTVFLSVAAFYLLVHLSSAGKSEGRGHNYGRKLLSLVSTKTTEIDSLNETNSSKFWHNESAILEDPLLQQNNCTPPAIDEFPYDGLTRDQRRQGWVAIHVIIACYCFWLLAAICDDYFVPAVEMMCLTFKMNEDVVGATFMAAATSSPELFINCVGTFVTEGDIGVGTIVGSAVFNILAVPACCGLLARKIVVLDWWPISRDCLMYCLAVLGLIVTLYDGRVMWYEALGLVIAYIFYISGMYYNDTMARNARKLVSKYRRFKIRPYSKVSEITPLFGIDNIKTSSISEKLEAGMMEGSIYINKSYKSSAHLTHMNDNNSSRMEDFTDIKDFADNPWISGDSNLFLYILRWPITFLLWITIPDCRKYPKLRYLTFFMSVVWIGAISYLVAFFITIVGDTLSIPDSVMGLTILAAGMSIPEAVSSVIVTNQGHGAMGISSSIGSNTFDILLCLGLPWFIKSYFLPTTPGEHWVDLNSSGLTYSAVSLLTTLLGLYISFALNKFQLDWKIGATCTVMYIGFLILASLIELNLFFDVNLPTCGH